MCYQEKIKNLIIEYYNEEKDFKSDNVNQEKVNFEGIKCKNLDYLSKDDMFNKDDIDNKEQVIENLKKFIIKLLNDKS